MAVPELQAHMKSCEYYVNSQSKWPIQNTTQRPQESARDKNPEKRGPHGIQRGPPRFFHVALVKGHEELTGTSHKPAAT
eukprot:1685556-Karenia_brevis.AAC.1